MTTGAVAKTQAIAKYTSTTASSAVGNASRTVTTSRAATTTANRARATTTLANRGGSTSVSTRSSTSVAQSRGVNQLRNGGVSSAVASTTRGSSSIWNSSR